MESLQSASSILRQAVAQASAGLIEREQLAELIVLAAVAGEHALVIGPPGTAKSAVVRRVARALGGRYFEYLLGRFTEPNEIFGPVDLAKLKSGLVEVNTANMLPEAEITFLDEVFLGSTAILNSLLGILNERRFRRGNTVMDCPLRICVGATNKLPEEEALAAFADRFLVHSFVEPVPDALLEDLLEGGMQLQKLPEHDHSGIEALDFLTRAALTASTESIRARLADCVRRLRKAGIELSDRRIVKAQRLVIAAAVLAGREHPTSCDLWPLVYCVPSKGGQEIAREVLAAELEASENNALSAAAEDASASVAARAERILARIAAVTSKNEDAELMQYQLEALAREIDAGFHPQRMPENLAQARKNLVERIDALRQPQSN